MDPIKLLFSGDFAPLIPVEKITDNHFSGLTEIFDATDLRITNLEAPLTNSQIPIGKTGPSIKADPVTISLLKKAKVNIACLANNHIFDYGEQGIEDTVGTCKRNNIDTMGIVSMKDGRDHWLVKTLKGKRIGFLNYCEHEFSVREKGLTGACGYDPVDAYYDINHLKPIVDYLIVIYHGGNEYYPLPRPDLKKDFHYLADLGADALIGHHTHVFSGYEIYNNKPLIYSLGNFFFPYEGEPESWYEGILCQLLIDNVIELKLYPVLQCKDGYNVKITKSESANSILNQIKQLSRIIENNEELEKRWNDYVCSTGEGLSRKILYSSKIDKILAGIPLFKTYFNNNKQRISILNILRCSSLRQLLIDDLNSMK
jgi:poly-gamma-glutamate synthesis protein (capsule biosynthesis protein)